MLRQGEAEPGLRDRALGHCAEWTAGGTEVDAAAVRQMADTIDSGDERQDSGAAVMSAAGKRLDDGMEAGGDDFDEHLAVCGNGIMEGGIAGWSAEGFDDRGVHGSSLEREYLSDDVMRRSERR